MQDNFNLDMDKLSIFFNLNIDVKNQKCLQRIWKVNL